MVLGDDAVLVFMLGFPSDCGFAHEEKRRNIQEMSNCEDHSQANQGAPGPAVRARSRERPLWRAQFYGT
jgi:hypothetical protein